MICGVIQSCYLPWRGYFDLIHNCDLFVFHDDIQYTKQDWRNRNRIKTPNGLKWLTVPAGSAPTQTNIDQVAIAGFSWARQHLAAIKNNYRKSPFFEDTFNFLESLLARPWQKLSDLNITLTQEIAKRLGIRAKFAKSSELKISGKKTDRIIDICRRTGADHYLSGPSAKAYLDEDKLRSCGIKLSYQNYNYPPYPQLFGPFEPQVSIIDLMFNCGPQAPQYIWGCP